MPAKVYIEDVSVQDHVWMFACIAELDSTAIPIAFRIDGTTAQGLRAVLAERPFRGVDQRAYRWRVFGYRAGGRLDSAERSYDASIRIESGRKRLTRNVPCSQTFAENLRWLLEEARTAEELKAYERRAPPQVDSLAGEPEAELPASVRTAAIRAGNEYGWRRADVFVALDAARDAGLVCLGGQVQFRFPDGTCELYWLNYDSAERRLGESDEEYVVRSHREVSEQLRALVASTDIEDEGRRSFRFLKEKEEAGERLADHLVFICDFVRADAGNP